MCLSQIFLNLIYKFIVFGMKSGINELTYSENKNFENVQPFLE